MKYNVLIKILIIQCFLLVAFRSQSNGLENYEHFLNLAPKGGDYVGNGGDVVFCHFPTGESAELLDLYEAKFSDPSYKLDIDASRTTLVDKVHFILNRLSDKSPIRSAQYRRWFSTFFEEVRFISSGRLFDIPDSEHLSFPSGCEVKQVAIQFEDGRRPPGVRYLIDRKLWNLLSTDQRVMLVLHELIYREALSVNHLDSKVVRKLVALVGSEVFENLQKEDFQDWVANNRLKDYKGEPIYPNIYVGPIESLEDRVDSLVSKAQVTKESTVNIFGLDLTLTPSTNVYFDSDGRIRGISADQFDSQHGPVKNSFLINIGKGVTEFNRNREVTKISWHRNGRIKSISGRGNLPYIVQSSHYGELIINPKKIDLQDNGALDRVTLSRKQDLWIGSLQKKVPFQGKLNFLKYDHPEIGNKFGGRIQSGNISTPTLIGLRNQSTLVDGRVSFDVSDQVYFVSYLAKPKSPVFVDVLKSQEGVILKVNQDIRLNSIGEVIAGRVSGYSEEFDWRGQTVSLKPHTHVWTSYDKSNSNIFTLRFETSSVLSVTDPKFSVNCIGEIKFHVSHGNFDNLSCHFAGIGRINLQGKNYQSTSAQGHLMMKAGEVKRLYLTNNADSFVINVQNRDVNVRGVTFHSNRLVSDILLLSTESFNDQVGRSVHFKGGDIVYFSKNGSLQW